MVTKKEVLERLKEYYKREDSLIIGMNGSQAIRVSKKLKKDLELSTRIDATSFTMNKTEHFDYFLDANLSLEEIKLSQIYSTVDAIKHILEDTPIPTQIGELGKLSRFMYRINEEDKQKHIRDMIQTSKEPIFVYSSGENNLMREVGNNPGAIMGDYKRRNTTPNFYYSIEKAKDEKTLEIVLEGIERNFNHILSLNEASDIYTLGTYVPRILDAEELKVFKELIIKYNEKLQKLCQKYGCSFVSIEKIGSSYLTNDRLFHPTSKGSTYIEENILLAMYKKKLEKKDTSKITVSYNPIYNIKEKGASYIENACFTDAGRSCLKTMATYGYEHHRKIEEEKEHIREAKIFQKVKEKELR